MCTDNSRHQGVEEKREMVRDRGGDFKGFICLERVTHEYMCAVIWE